MEIVRRVSELTGKSVEIHEFDFCLEVDLKFMQGQSFDAVLHFAGFKAVGESIAKPLEYYRTMLARLCHFTNQSMPRGIFVHPNLL